MQQATEGEVAVVTGTPVGIGFETSLALARNGFHTYATMRKPRRRRIKSDYRYSQK